MATGAAKIIERLDAVAGFLSSIVGTAAFDGMRSAQMNSMMSMLSSSSLQLSEATAIIEKLKATNWSPAQLIALTEMAVSSVGAPQPAKHRNNLQDYVHLPHYFTAELWAAMGSTSTTASCKLESLLWHAVRLGLRTPTEATVQMMTGLYIMVAEDGNDASLLPSFRLQTLHGVKNNLKRMVGKHSAAIEHCDSLPVAPADFQRKFPLLWTAAFGDNSPCKCIFAMRDIENASSATPMRSSRSDARKHAPVQLQIQDQGMQQMAACFMQQMQQMQNLQQMTLAALTGQASSSGSVASIEDKSPLLRRMNSRLEIGNGSASEAAGWLPTSLAPAGEPRSSPLEAPPAAEEARPPIAEEAPPPAAEEVRPAKLRKTVADATAVIQQCIANKKAAAAAEKLSPVPKAKSKAQAKGKAKGKAKAKAKAKAKGKAESSGKAPFWAWERTRGQIMCRTGFKGPGNSHAIKIAGNEKDAAKKADAWVKEQTKNRK